MYNKAKLLKMACKDWGPMLNVSFCMQIVCLVRKHELNLRPQILETKWSPTHVTQCSKAAQTKTTAELGDLERKEQTKVYFAVILQTDQRASISQKP